MSAQTKFSYDVVETRDGQKLTIEFDYSQQIIDGFHQMNYAKTHRMYNDPDDSQCYVDFTCWTIDYTEDALERFERELGTAVPDQYWPGDSPGDDSTVTMRIPEGRSHFRVEANCDRIKNLLDSQFSYMDEDAEYTRSYQNGNWDGRHHLFDTASREAPIGLLDQARDLLESEGFDVKVEWEDRNKGSDIDTNWQFEHDLRPYQTNTIESLLDNDGGITVLPTGTGKTVTAMRFIHTLESRALVLVHTKELLHQWADRIKSTLGVDPGVIGDGHYREGPVTVATLQTLMQRQEDPEKESLSDDYGVVIFDECHRTSAAEKMFELGTDLDAYYRVGLSATPWRRVEGENIKIEAAIGSVAHEVAADTMIEKGYLADPVFDVVDPSEYGQQRRAGQHANYQFAYQKVIETDPVRITAIADKTLELARQGYQVLVNVNRIGQGRLIASALNAAISEDDVVEGIDNGDRIGRLRECYRNVDQVADTDATMLCGKDTQQRDPVLREFENGDRQILVSTLVQEGIDLPDLNAVVMAQGNKSSIQTIQTIGRALRPSGGDDAQIVNVADAGRFFQSAYRERQKTVTNYYNLDRVPTVESAPVRASNAANAGSASEVAPQH